MISGWMLTFTLVPTPSHSLPTLAGIVHGFGLFYLALIFTEITQIIDLVQRRWVLRSQPLLIALLAPAVT